MALTGATKYIVGVLLALISGVFSNLGALFEKKAVNQYFANKRRYMALDKSFSIQDNPDAYRTSNIPMNMKEICFSRMWLIGFFLQFLLGTGGFLAAQGMIGPGLTPALGAIGLIVLVFASGFVNEKLNWLDYVGIFMMIGAVSFLAFSKLEIDASKADFLETSFLVRVVIFTSVMAGLCVGCRVWAMRKDRWEGTVLASLVGFCIAMSNYWISPLITVGVTLLLRKSSTNPTFENHSTGPIVMLTLTSLVIVVFFQVYAVYVRQLAFRVGNAATMVPISHVSSHLSGPIIYYFVFGLRSPESYSLPFMLVGLFLLGLSSFIFAKREAMFDEQREGIPAEMHPLSPKFEHHMDETSVVDISDVDDAVFTEEPVLKPFN